MHPEVNAPFFVTRFSDVSINNVLNDGYNISIQDVDPRWMFGDEPSFAAWFLGNNEVVVKCPSSSYFFMHDHAIEEKGSKLVKFDNKRIELAKNTARTRILADRANRGFIYIMLHFPMDVKKVPGQEEKEERLSNEVFSPGAENGKINIKVVPLESTFNLQGSKITAHRCNLEWLIAIDEVDKRKTKPSKTTNELEDQMSGLFSGMSVS